MKKIKSILAILLTFAVCLGCLSVPAMAESHEKWDDGTYKYGKYIDINDKTTYEVIGYVGTIPEDGTLYFPAKNSRGNKITEVYSTRRFLNDSGAWLKKIVIPDGYNTIMGLNNIEGLEEVVLPSSVQYIGLHAFYGCMNLRKINLTHSIKNIGTDAFAFTAIKEITIPNSIEPQYTGGMSTNILMGLGTFAESQLEKATLENGIKWVPNCMFLGTKYLKSVSIPESVTEIGVGAFHHSAISEIKLPSKLELIREAAFGYMDNLKELHLPKTMKELSADFIDGREGVIKVTYAGTKADFVKKVKIVHEGSTGGAWEKATIQCTDGNITLKQAVAARKSGLPVTSIKLDSTISVNKGKSVQLWPKENNGELIDVSKVKWKSSKKSVATVKNGKVTARKVGKTVITATINGRSAKCTVTVKIPVKKVKFSKKSLTIKKGKTKKLKVTISPSNATNKKVTWKSSNTSIVSVSSKGKIKAKKKGTAYIYATSKDSGKKAKIKIKVK